MPKPADDVKRLLAEYLELSVSAENQRRLSCWELEYCARDQWHGRPRLGAFRRERAVPITIDLQNPFWFQLHPFDLSETYRDPLAYLRFYLSKRVTSFKLIPDDTPLDGVIQVYMGTVFECNFYGVPAHFFADRDAIIDQQPVVNTPDDIERLPPVDFYRSGLMSDAHRIYEGIKDFVGDQMTVVFPEWLRGPFGVALYLRGYQELLVDMMEQPEYAHALLAKVTHDRKKWFVERARYLGEPVPAGSLFNDEVDAGVIGRRHYREHIRPFEEELGTFHGRISYWHSCGNTGPMAREIVAMNRVDMLDVSGWTDKEQVLASLDNEAPRLEMRLHPLKDLQDATPEWMAEKVHSVLATARKHDVGALTIRVSGLQPWRSVEEDLDQVKQWVQAARWAIEEQRG